MLEPTAVALITLGFVALVGGVTLLPFLWLLRRYRRVVKQEATEAAQFQSAHGFSSVPPRRVPASQIPYGPGSPLDVELRFERSIRSNEIFVEYGIYRPEKDRLLPMVRVTSTRRDPSRYRHRPIVGDALTFVAARWPRPDVPRETRLVKSGDELIDASIDVFTSEGRCPSWLARVLRDYLIQGNGFQALEVAGSKITVTLDSTRFRDGVWGFSSACANAALALEAAVRAEIEAGSA